MEEPISETSGHSTTASAVPSSSSSSASILSEKVQRALQIQTNTSAMKTALEALGQLASSSTHSKSTDFALDARSVRHAIEYDALQQALSLRSELSSLCDTLQELRQGIAQTAQIAHQVKQSIHAPVMIKSYGGTTAAKTGSNSLLDKGGSTSTASSGAGLANPQQQDEEQLATTLAEAFTKRNLAQERLKAVHQFMETFDLSEQDSRLLDHYNFDDLEVSLMEGGTPVNGTAFLKALERVKEIRQALSKTFGSGQVLASSDDFAGGSSSSSLGASSAMRMMEHLAQKQEQAFERLYHWLQSHLQLFAPSTSSSSQQPYNKTKRVAFENEASHNPDSDTMDQALQHPFVQSALYTLRHVPAFYRHMLELIASKRRQEETRIFLLALTSGYNGMPPLERLAHDSVAYVGDMLAFAFRSLSMEADVAMTIVHFSQQQKEQEGEENKEDGGDTEGEQDDSEPLQAGMDGGFVDYTTEKPLTSSEILSTIMSGMARPLKSRITNVIATLSSRDDGGNDGDSDGEGDDDMLDDYFEEKDASVRNKLTNLYDICGLLLFYLSAMEKTIQKLEKADEKGGLHKAGLSEEFGDPSTSPISNALLVNVNACLNEGVKAFEATVRVYSATLGTLSTSSGESAANLAKALIVRIADVRQSSPGFAQDVACHNQEHKTTLSPTWITTQVVEAALPFCSVLDDTVILKSAVSSVQGEAMDIVAADRLEKLIDETKVSLLDKLIEEETSKAFQLCGLGRVTTAWEQWRQSGGTDPGLMMSHPGLSAESLGAAFQDFDKSLYSTSLIPSLEAVVKDASTRKLVRSKIADRLCEKYEEMYGDIVNDATGGYDEVSFLGHTPQQVRTLFSV